MSRMWKYIAKKTSKFLVVALIVLLCVGFVVYGIWSAINVYFLAPVEMELYSDVTYNGYEIKILQQRLGDFTRCHKCVLLVNGEEYLNFTILSPDSTINFPEDLITCEYDNETGYRLLFDPDHYPQMELCFDADFTELQFACTYDLKILKSGFPVREKTILDWWG